ncbi:hypothetical protein [Mycobacterium colombiense]|uniref:hypothetical protein n=1 Tax=Mycobacterium colombiense TaxID=339268 RepID=UPI000A78E567|nr:hypothetical protein [Mycobacterium colombiense]
MAKTQLKVITTPDYDWVHTIKDPQTGKDIGEKRIVRETVPGGITHITTDETTTKASTRTDDYRWTDRNGHEWNHVTVKDVNGESSTTVTEKYTSRDGRQHEIVTEKSENKITQHNQTTWTSNGVEHVNNIDITQSKNDDGTTYIRITTTNAWESSKDGKAHANTTESNYVTLPDGKTVRVKSDGTPLPGNIANAPHIKVPPPPVPEPRQYEPAPSPNPLPPPPPPPIQPVQPHGSLGQLGDDNPDLVPSDDGTNATASNDDTPDLADPPDDGSDLADPPDDTNATASNDDTFDLADPPDDGSDLADPPDDTNATASNDATLDLADPPDDGSDSGTGSSEYDSDQCDDASDFV